MNESIFMLCNSVKDKFPEISKLADIEYQKQWSEFDDSFYSYSWFEALANALNGEMQKYVAPEKHTALLEFIHYSYMMGTDEVKKTIDTAFVENLFWQISSEKAKPYWEALPEVLKSLYYEFHRCRPVQQ